jgi:hypothetical protein
VVSRTPEPHCGDDLGRLRVESDTSIYRFDDELLANAHVWGVNAYMAPVLHLRRLAEGSLFDTYAGSFEAVWATSRPVSPERLD